MLESRYPGNISHTTFSFLTILAIWHKSHSPPQPYPAERRLEMSEQDNIRIIKDAYELFKKGDIPGLLNMLTDDVEWITPGPKDIMPVAGQRRGRNGVAEFFSTLSSQENVEVFEPEEYIAQGDKVVAII
jgi:hypothetical protein